jgi:hypothetical protein
MAATTDPKKSGTSRGTLSPTDIVSIRVDVATAKSLILALSQAIGGGTGYNPKKEGKDGGGSSLKK